MLVGGRGHLTIVYCWSINWIKEKIRRMLISVLQTFGVQVHDLPPGLTSKGLGRSLGNIMGAIPRSQHPKQEEFFKAIEHSEANCVQKLDISEGEIIRGCLEEILVSRAAVQSP
ncbi:hypothetical protein Golob_023480 [Gossypium lobatum]|uniref:Uncharacterized protein n=1 Tax=Gossypium lobatum TaxID=34289 RepID=A0A7J8LJX4_9ROSI|nr:hypothetical protein [Gossypium lobatum]